LSSIARLLNRIDTALCYTTCVKIIKRLVSNYLSFRVRRRSRMRLMAR
jgi:hypothetical protein